MVNTVALICNKILDLQEKAILLLKDTSEEQTLDEKLWVFSAGEFLPHISSSSPEFKEFSSYINIAMHNAEDNIINAQNLIIFNKEINIESLKLYNKVFYVFAGDIEGELKSARELWKEVSNFKNDFTLNFYEQNADKNWVLKAT